MTIKNYIYSTAESEELDKIWEFSKKGHFKMPCISLDSAGEHGNKSRGIKYAFSIKNGGEIIIRDYFNYAEIIFDDIAQKPLEKVLGFSLENKALLEKD